MPTSTTTHTPGRPCWVDGGFDDIDRAVAFYGALLGWDVEEGAPQFGGYRNARLHGKRVAGMAPKMDPNQPSAWTTYLATDNTSATVNAVKNAGGQVIMGEMVVGDFGTMSLFVDPTGAFTGLWEGNQHTGYEVWGEPGAVCWTEQWSRDDAKARDFYSHVFGYSYEQVPNEDTTMNMFASPGDPLHYGLIAKMTADMPDAVPAHWMTYFAVTDIAQAIETVENNGGQVAYGPLPTPYGTIYGVLGPEKEMFSLIQMAYDK